MIVKISAYCGNYSFDDVSKLELDTDGFVAVHKSDGIVRFISKREVQDIILKDEEVEDAGQVGKV